MKKFELDISYHQVSVFAANMEKPFNDWTDTHVAQGFSWRSSSVSFGTLDSQGTLAVEIFSGRDFKIDYSTAVRVIAVPFYVPDPGGIEVSSISSGCSANLIPGEYELIFEHGKNSDKKMWAKFFFRAVRIQTKAQVLLADPELSPPEELDMFAEPA